MDLAKRRYSLQGEPEILCGEQNFLTGASQEFSVKGNIHSISYFTLQRILIYPNKNSNLQITYF